MELIISLALILAGLALLAGGGEVLIRGAVAIARLAGLTTAVIGLTVVAFGTSLPELTVSILAALRGQPDIAFGNVVGSNIFNLIAILGFTAVVRPVPIHGSAVKLEWPVVVVTSALCLLIIRDGTIDRFEGAFFVLGLVTFIAFSVWMARRQFLDGVLGEDAAGDERVPEQAGASAAAKSVLLVIVGLVSLVVGGRLLVDGSVQLARLAGLTERVIGLTIVAAGTSAPEMAASVVAARRGHPEIAVANLLGSNIFNVLAILGIASLVTPITVSPEMVRVDAWWMMGTALALFPFMRTGRHIARWEGAVLVSVYVVYVSLLLR